MAINVIVATIITGFNLGLTLMPFLLSWSLTLNVSTLFLIAANIFVYDRSDPVYFFLAWITILFGTIQSCVFLRSTINSSRMLTFWHYGSAPLHGHLRNQYFEIALRAFVAAVYTIEGIFFSIESTRTIALLAIRLIVNAIILAGCFVYFHYAFKRPTVAQFYIAMMITTIFADIGTIITVSTAGEDATAITLIIFFSVHGIAFIVSLLVTAIYGSAYNRFRAHGNNHTGSERLYPVFRDHQLYEPSLWLYIPAWFRSSPAPIEYLTNEDDEVSALRKLDASTGTSLDSPDTTATDPYNTLYDVSAIDTELEEISNSASVAADLPPLMPTKPIPSNENERVVLAQDPQVADPPTIYQPTKAFRIIGRPKKIALPPRQRPRQIHH